jgi:hypothetical protein
MTKIEHYRDEIASPLIFNLAHKTAQNPDPIPQDIPPTLLWRNPSPNSHYSFKPLCLVLEKESQQLALELYKL